MFDFQLPLPLVVYEVTAKLLSVRINVETELCQNREPHVFWSYNDVVVHSVCIHNGADEAIGRFLLGPEMSRDCNLDLRWER